MINESHCLETVKRAEASIDTHLIDEPGVYWVAFRYADCCRKLGRFDLATKLIDRLEQLSQPISAEIRRGIEVHRAAIAAKQTAFVLDDGTNNPGFETDAAPAVIPPLTTRLWNFAGAMANWAAAGFPTRSQAEVEERMAICQACPLLVNSVCQKCGCSVDGLINKLAVKTEKCPDGRWE